MHITNENVLKSFKEKIKIFEAMQSDPETFIFEEFAELRRLVDLDRENAIKEINELADDLINKLESYQKQLKVNSQLNSNLVGGNSMIEKMKTELVEYEQCLKSLVSSDNDRTSRSKQIKILDQILEREILSFKYKLLGNKSIKYEPIRIEIKNFCGKLLFNSDLVQFPENRNLIQIASNKIVNNSTNLCISTNQIEPKCRREEKYTPNLFNPDIPLSWQSKILKQ